MGIFGHNKSDGHPELVITNARVVNNTVYNCTTGTWGVYIPNGTGNEVYNNLWVDSYTPTSNITVAGTENSNTSINSFTAGLVGSNDKIYSSGDPFVNQAQGDFQLTGNTDPGTNFSTLFTADMVGNPYTTGTWDRGAFQYAQGSGGGNITLIAPTGLHVVAAP